MFPPSAKEAGQVAAAKECPLVPDQADTPSSDPKPGPSSELYSSSSSSLHLFTLLSRPPSVQSVSLLLRLLLSALVHA